MWPWKACFYAILGLAAAVLLTAAILLLGKAWRVDSVSVEGTVQYDAEIIADASGIAVGESMTDFDRRSLEETLKKDYPLIRSVKVRRRLNGEVILKITEETDIYYTCHHSNYYLISGRDLTVLGVSSYGVEYQSYGAVYLGLPEEARVRVGEKLTFAYLPYEPVSAPEPLATYEIETKEAEEEYRYVWTFREKVESSALAGHITGMELGDKYDLYLVYDGHVKIRFGSMDELDRKISQAIEVLERELDGERALAVLDVSDIQKSTYREDSNLDLPEWAAS